MDKESQDKVNQSLLLAAENSDWGAVRHLISLGADINTVRQSYIFSGCTVIWLAAYCSRWDIVKEYTNVTNLDSHPTLGYLKGVTIVWLAAEAHNWGLVSDIFLNVNLDIFPNNKPGHTVIYLAAKSYNWKMVDLLQDKANLDIHPNDGKTIIWLAADARQWLLVEKLLTKADISIYPRNHEDMGKTIIWLATNDKQWWLVEKLIDKSDLNVYCTNYTYGRSLTWLAAKNKQWGLVKMLSLKADLNILPVDYNGKGESVIWLAAKDKQWDLVKELSFQSDINIFPLDYKKKGESVIWLAAKDKQWSLVKELSFKSDLNICPSEGEEKNKTVIWLAAEDMQLDLVYSLSTLGANPCLTPDTSISFDMLFGKNRYYRSILFMLWASVSYPYLENISPPYLSHRFKNYRDNIPGQSLYKSAVNICHNFKMAPFKQCGGINANNNITWIEMLPQSLINLVSADWLFSNMRQNMLFNIPSNLYAEQYYYLNKIITNIVVNDTYVVNSQLINKNISKSLLKKHYDIIFLNILSYFRKNPNLFGVERTILPSKLNTEDEYSLANAVPISEHAQKKSSACSPGIFSLFRSSHHKEQASRDKPPVKKSSAKTKSPEKAPDLSINLRVVKNAKVNKHTCNKIFSVAYHRRKMMLSIQAKEDKLFFNKHERENIYHAAETMTKIEGCETINPGNIDNYFKYVLSMSDRPAPSGI